MHRTFPMLLHQPVTHLLSACQSCGAAPAAPGLPRLPAAPSSPKHLPPGGVDHRPAGSRLPTPRFSNAKSKRVFFFVWMLRMPMCSISLLQLPLPSVRPGLWDPLPVHPVPFQGPLCHLQMGVAHLSCPWGTPRCVSGPQCCGRAEHPHPHHHPAPLPQRLHPWGRGGMSLW